MSEPTEPATGQVELCECGHSQSDHKPCGVQDGGAKWVCFATDEKNIPVCDCESYRQIPKPTPTDIKTAREFYEQYFGEIGHGGIYKAMTDYAAHVLAGAASVDRRAIVEEAFEKGRASVVFNPHSHYRDKLREMICEGDFDFTKIFEEIEYEGETYADISNEGADALADYFIDLMEQIDERRSEDVVTVNICDTCEEPYQVNANFDKHDCGKAGAASVDRRAIVDLLRGWLDWFNGPYTEGCDYINPPLTKTNAVLAEMGGDDENSKM